MRGLKQQVKVYDRDTRVGYNGDSWYHYYFEIDENGNRKNRCKQGFASKEEAIESSKKLETEYESRARRFGYATRLGNDISFKEYLQYYYDEILAPKTLASTKVVYAYTLYNHILPNSPNIALNQISDLMLNKILEEINKTSKTYANKAREFMLIALKHAVKNEARLNKVPHLNGCNRKKSEIKVLKKDELQLLLGACAGRSWYLEILLGVFMGLRKAEIRGLRFEDFSDDFTQVTIKSQLKTDVILKEGSTEREKCVLNRRRPKTTNSIRKLGVPSLIADELKKRKKKVQYDKELLGERYCDEGLVSCQEDGKPRGEASLNSELTKMCKRLGINHITVHGLRHTYATIILEQGYSIQECSAVLGHKSVLTTMEFYADVMDSDEKLLELWNETYQVSNGG